MNKSMDFLKTESFFARSVIIKPLLSWELFRIRVEMRKLA